MTPAQIRKVWIQIAIPLVFSLLLLAGGLIMRSMSVHRLAAPGAFMCLGGVAGIVLFGAKAAQFITYLRNTGPHE